MKVYSTAYKISSWLPVLVVCSLIFYISSYQTATVSSVPQDEFLLKKIAHIMWSSTLALLTFRALIRGGHTKRDACIGAILFVFFFGCSDEIHQRFVVGRESRFRDVMIDTIGASLGILVLWKLLPKAPKKLRNLAARLDLA